jgi:hypothetical protein
MHCVYSIGTNNTEYNYVYNTDSEQSESEPQIEYGDGDNVVNAQSLRVCQQWKRDGQPVYGEIILLIINIIHYNVHIYRYSVQ